jgi:putative endonuclease
MEKEWYFYIVKCSDSSFYSGISDNVEQRVKKHNSGKGAKYTSVRRPVILVYKEKYPNVSEARKREAQIKNWSRGKKEQLIAGFPRLGSLRQAQGKLTAHHERSE